MNNHGAINNEDEIKEYIINKLTNLRTKLSKELQMPPFSILSEHALMKIAATTPSTNEGLLKIKGLTEDKITLFGGDILELIASATSRAPTIKQIHSKQKQAE